MDQFQSLEIAPIFEKTFPFAGDYGVDHQRKLIEEIVLEQGSNHCWAACDSDVLSGLTPEFGDLFREVAFDQLHIVELRASDGVQFR